MILTVTLNPCIDKTIFVTHFQKGKKVVVEGIKKIAGGKGNNVARVIKNLGHEVLSFCVVGGQEGRIIEELLGQDSIPLQAVWAKKSQQDGDHGFGDQNKPPDRFLLSQAFPFLLRNFRR
ncbi:hypothetical protein HKBW3S03_00131 [Candidatus Hakubella thermalkaliphila]|uniref:Carbohydrate kinase PfkB domain-containing protein n=1 Tax=Candidatus Hakubella thermalkaliphila TaxID=2754717 RepID=A0A6V8NJD0_9ACTN|nr:PfkB family carbohydrate kinase [Candidatus Hakubella thermalkaliphila]GFP18626.1 hypothetical protein HKBW3S03_00131 [Candidatus Hakubella thermalkaliphila]